jgi:hypothetical protein
VAFRSRKSRCKNYTDHFLMEVAVNDNEEELVSFPKSVEVKVIEKH